ncbi:unnamed protein product [Lampetra planeri]
MTTPGRLSIPSVDIKHITADDDFSRLGVGHPPRRVPSWARVAVLGFGTRTSRPVPRALRPGRGRPRASPRLDRSSREWALPRFTFHVCCCPRHVVNCEEDRYHEASHVDVDADLRSPRKWRG